MANPTSTRIDENEEDWIVLSPEDAPYREANTPSKNVYLLFQLRTMFGHFSYTSRSLQKKQHATTRIEGENGTIINSQCQSPFFQLPTELRLNIYEHICRVPITNPFGSVELTHRPARDRTPTTLSVLLTCRRLLEEAETLFYTVNRVSVSRPGEFCASLGPKRRAAITSLTVKTGADAMYLALKELKNFENVKSLHLERTASVRFQNVRFWAVMEKQIIAELQEMKRLSEMRVIMPEARDLTNGERERAVRLGEIDGRIEGCVGGGRKTPRCGRGRNNGR